MADPRLVAAVREIIYESLHPGQRSGQLADRLAEAVVERLGVVQVDMRVLYSLADEVVFMASRDALEVRGSAAFRDLFEGQPVYRVRILESDPTP